ncbi:MAG TPA: L-idonate 5-dehydrogenase [Acetobacteraceae bacterium]|nr:L-idonate 5-dehydrogenase [Acetobacteraceae bacterium]
MKAAVIHAARDLRIGEAAIPELGPHDVQVRIRNGGICGSDLHYYQDGGFGAVRIREPLIPGHEIAGEVMATGAAVTRVRAGDRVAVNPSRPCGQCEYCLEGKPRHCLDMRFFGSAMRFPHVQGGFREVLVCTEAQAVRVPEGVSLERAAFAEPLSVCLHAANQAGALMGKRVLVTGTGPIGALAILVARHAGAREVVATDLADTPLAVARRIGADHAINVRADPAGLDRFAVGKGYFDVVFEASGSGAALASAIQVARPCGVIVQLGIGGDMTVPVNTVVAKEIDLRGSFRFDVEFDWAVDFIASGAIDVAPLLTEVVPLDDVVRAFELAGDRSRAMKVQVAL